MTQLTGQAYVERYGHEWNVPERAQEYVQRVDKEADQRAEGFKVMVSLIPFERAQSIRVLDIGAGQGSVAALVLDAFPNATAVGLDVSEPMRAIAAERMAAYGDRFGYHIGDFVDGALPADLAGPFDVAVSSRAIHHLPADAKQRLYRAVFAALNPGGAIFNLDSVAPADAALRGRYRTAEAVLRGRPAPNTWEAGSRPASAGHYYEPLDEHLGFLSAAGFTQVDCAWKRLRVVLLSGVKPA